MTLEEYFQGYEESWQIFLAVRQAVEEIGPAGMRVTRSQVAFWRRRLIASVWIPDRYLRGKHAPLVLTFSFRQPDPSPRWKEIVEPAPGRFTHHLELFSPAEVDEAVRAWLRTAWSIS